MKKVFSSLILLLSFPARILKKTRLDNFFGGLIIGAIFSLLVNVVTVQVQEIIKKQRVYESIENEILNNLVTANNIIKLNSEDLNNKKEPSYLYTPRKYSRDIWEQSSDALQFISQLDRETQNKISLYYIFTIPSSNAVVEKIEYITRDKLADCFLKSGNLAEVEKSQCVSTYEILLSFEKLPAEWTSEASYELLQNFHPTKDRLNSFFLRLILGSESTRPLSDN